MSDRHKHGGGIGWVLLIGIPLCIVFWAWVATADTYPLKRNDRGGLVVEYIQRVTDHNAAGDRVELTMRLCLSACTLLLGVNDVCVSPRTRFGFHGVRISGKISSEAKERIASGYERRMAQVYPPALGAWFLSHAAGKIMPRYLTGSDLIERYGFEEC